MAQITSAQHKAAIEAQFPTNGTGAIGASRVRTHLGTNLGDSAMFLSDHFIDEDDMASDSATKVPSQQSVKAYVDAQLSSGGIETATVTVSSAEILQLKTTRKTLIAAPGANKIIQVLNVTCEYDYGTTTYVDGTPLEMNYGTGTADVWRSNVLSQTVTTFAFSIFGDPVYIPLITDDIRNQAITLKTDAANNPSVGDGTLKFVISYRIIDFT